MNTLEKVVNGGNNQQGRIITKELKIMQIIINCINSGNFLGFSTVIRNDDIADKKIQIYL